MSSRLLLCPKRTIETIGFNEIKRSKKYDILRTIGKDKDVDMSGYSEIVLLYQYPLKETNGEFLDFVRKYQDRLKNATLLFDIPMEILEEIGLVQSKEYMDRICKDVFSDDNISISVHAPTDTDASVHKFAKQIDMKVNVNTGWGKQSGHTALLTAYHFQEIGLKVKKIYKSEMIIGAILAVIGTILAILETAGVMSSGLVGLYALVICFGVIVAISGYNGRLKDIWRN